MSDVPRIDPVAVRSAQFQGSFRKYDSRAVDQYLADLADDLVKLNNYIDELERQVAAAPRLSARAGEPARDDPDDAGPVGLTIFEAPSLATLSAEELTKLVGEETAHVLSTARQAADDIRSKAEESASRMIREATAEAKTLREEAESEAERARTDADAIRDQAKNEADAEAQRILDSANADAERRVTEARAMADDELVRAERVRSEADEDAERIRNDAKEEGRAMLAEAKEVRKQILEDLQRRRDQGRAQIERLVVGRDRLLEAYASVRANVDEMTRELETVLDNPFERDPGMDEGFVGIVSTSTDDAAAGIEIGAAGPDDAAVPVEPAAEADDDTTEIGVEATEVEDRPIAEATSEAPEAAADEQSEAQDEVEPAGAADERQTPVADIDDATAIPEATDVDELFARIRAEREESVARAQAVLADGSTAADGQSPDAAVTADADVASTDDGEGHVGPEDGAGTGDVDQVPAEHLATGPVFEHRREVVESLSKNLSRNLKRQLADEQNQVLDALRRTESTNPDDLLPAEDDHLESYAAVAQPILADAAGAASDSSGGAQAPEVTAVAASLAAALVEPFRRRVVNSASEVGEDHEAFDERLRSLYREWKIEHIGPASSDALYSAYALGQFSAAPDDARLRWLIDPEQGPCPDAQDNALEGPVTKGDAFPTGDRCPQAHAGCRCLLLVEPG